jgi:hydrogenase/urease accessory protein HupE
VPAGITALSLLLLGILVAADLRFDARIVAALAAALGLIGIAALLFVAVTLAAALVVSLEKAWARIAVRVAGSWIAATGLLLAGWTLSGRI